MPWFRTPGGVVLEIDVPAGGHALERHQEKLDKGELVPVAHAERIDLADGAYTWREAASPAPDEELADAASGAEADVVEDQAAEPAPDEELAAEPARSRGRSKPKE